MAWSPFSTHRGPQEGQLKDQTLAELLRLLAWQNLGLVVVTTRLRFDDIRDLRATTAPVIELGHLSPQAGAQLLRALRVDGEQKELEDVSRAFGGHSPALNLLGGYLRAILDGDVRRRGQVSLLEEDEEQAGQARRIMRSYEEQFGESPELAVADMDPPFRNGIRVLYSSLHAPVLRNGARPRVRAEPPVALTGVSLAGLEMRRLVGRESLAAVETRLTHGASPPARASPVRTHARVTDGDQGRAMACRPCFPCDAPAGGQDGVRMMRWVP